MSPIPAHGLRLVGAAACLLGFAGGCRAVPPAPPAATHDGRYSEADEDDGWLFDGLSGRTAAESRPDSSSGVRQTSALEPVAPVLPGPELSPATGVPIPPDLPSEESGDSGYELSDFYPTNIVDTVKKATGNGPDEALARALYREGKTLFEQKSYEEAVGKFKTAAKRAPDSPLEEDALFMLGESHFFSDRYPKANAAYEQLLTKYAYTSHLDKVVTRLFAIGRYWEQLDAAKSAWQVPVNVADSTRPTFDAWGNALKAYKNVRMHDPTGPLADDSIMATANAYFLKHRYEEAAYHYDLLRKEYPKSEYQVEAHLLGMKSKEKMYQGPMYDGRPLEEAGKIADQTLRQFRGQLNGQGDLVVEAKNRYLQQQADRDWAIAQYYDKRKYYGAARFYYQAIIRDFPRTAAAQKAQARLAEIKDLPAEPVNRFKWLTDLFPS